MFKLLSIIPRIFITKGNPLQMIFFITSRCNLNCKHCFYLDNLNKKHNELSLEEIEKMTRSMGRLLWISLTGGEPFLRKDIAQVVNSFYRNTKFHVLSISSNGLQTESTVAAVSQMCRESKNAYILVYISIDGLEQTHETIRGAPRTFQKSLKTIEELKKLKAQFSNLGVGTITTINAQNQHEMKELANFLKNEVKPDTMTINMLRGKPRSTPLGEIDLKHYYDFLEVEKQGWDSGDLRHFSMLGSSILKRREVRQKEIISKIFEKNEYVLPCRAADISCVLSETGDLYACELLEEKIGNIRDHSHNFKSLWRSKKTSELKAFIKDTKCFCTYECAMTTNILFNPRELAKLFFKNKLRPEKSVPASASS